MQYANPFSLRLIDEKKKKLEVISKKKARTLNKQIEFILNQYKPFVNSKKEKKIKKGILSVKMPIHYLIYQIH